MLVKVLKWTQLYWKRGKDPFGMIWSIWGAGKRITGVDYTCINSLSQFASITDLSEALLISQGGRIFS